MTRTTARIWTYIAGTGAVALTVLAAWRGSQGRTAEAGIATGFAAICGGTAGYMAGEARKAGQR